MTIDEKKLLRDIKQYPLGLHFHRRESLCVQIASIFLNIPLDLSKFRFQALYHIMDK